MRESDVTNWATFKQWVEARQHPALGNFGEWWFKELQVIVSAPATGEIQHVDVEISRIPLTGLSGGSKDRERRLEKYRDVLHDNAWKVYILVHSDFPGRKETESFKMFPYYGTFLRDKKGKLVYFRAINDDDGTHIWGLPGLARTLLKQLTKE